GERLDREGIVHGGLELRFGGHGHRIPFTELTGRSIWIYGQQEVVKDLVDARVASSRPLLYEAEAIAIEGFGTDRAVVRYRHEGEERKLECDFVAGCDGFHGISRRAIAAGALSVFSREYPFAWLGILAVVPPSSDELIYAHSERGFAL